MSTASTIPPKPLILRKAWPNPLTYDTEELREDAWFEFKDDFEIDAAADAKNHPRHGARWVEKAGTVLDAFFLWWCTTIDGLDNARSYCGSVYAELGREMPESVPKPIQSKPAQLRLRQTARAQKDITPASASTTTIAESMRAPSSMRPMVVVPHIQWKKEQVDKASPSLALAADAEDEDEEDELESDTAPAMAISKSQQTKASASTAKRVYAVYPEVICDRCLGRDVDCEAYISRAKSCKSCMKGKIKCTYGAWEMVTGKDWFGVDQFKESHKGRMPAMRSVEDSRCLLSDAQNAKTKMKDKKAPVDMHRRDSVAFNQLTLGDPSVDRMLRARIAKGDPPHCHLGKRIDRAPDSYPQAKPGFGPTKGQETSNAFQNSSYMRTQGFEEPPMPHLSADERRSSAPDLGRGLRLNMRRPKGLEEACYLMAFRAAQACRSVMYVQSQLESEGPLGDELAHAYDQLVLAVELHEFAKYKLKGLDGRKIVPIEKEQELQVGCRTGLAKAEHTQKATKKL